MVVRDISGHSSSHNTSRNWLVSRVSCSVKSSVVMAKIRW
jgi:hypothetical protein